MKKNHRKTNLLFRAVMLMALLMGTATLCVAQDDNSEVTVGDVSNTACADHTRSESVMGRPTLKLTRSESGLYGELANYEVNCAYGDVNVICQENGQKLDIGVDMGYGDEFANCLCHINIYFTLCNALNDEYQLTLNGRDIGTVSFKEHSVVEIDLLTLEQAYEEGFEYPVEATYFWPYEITNSVGHHPDYDFSQSLNIYTYEKNKLSCVYMNYILPCDYNYLDAQARLDQDGTLVINVLTDGIPDKDCKRVAHLNFDIVNILRDSYHLRLNHTVMAGSNSETTVCLYEGDITVSEEYGDFSIPLNDQNDYKAIVAGINRQQVNAEGSDAPCYDLQGRRLRTPVQKKGVYIRDGKKRVVL